MFKLLALFILSQFIGMGNRGIGSNIYRGPVMYTGNQVFEIQGFGSTPFQVQSINGVQAGSTLVIYSEVNTIAISSIGDANGTTPIQASTVSFNGGANTLTTFYEPNVSAGTHQITITYDGSPDVPLMQIMEFSGTSLTAPLDTQTTSSGTGPSITAPSITPSANGEMIVASICATDAVSAGSGFTAISTSASSVISQYMALINTSPVVTTASTSSGAGYGMTVLVLK